MKYKDSKFYRTMKILFSWWYFVWYNPKIIGKENIPIDGSFILAGNHKSMMDPCALVVSTKRIIHFLAKDKYFNKKIIGNFFKYMQCIKVNTGVKNKDAMSNAIDVLNNEGAIGIFPEGTRNKTKEFLLPFKFGAVSMAKKTDSWIVPFGITGDYKFRSKNLIIRFGNPFKVGNMELEEANEKLFNEVKHLMLINKEVGGSN